MLHHRSSARRPIALLRLWLLAAVATALSAWPPPVLCVGASAPRWLLHPTCAHSALCSSASFSAVNVSIAPLGARVDGSRVTGRVVHLSSDPLGAFSVYPPAGVGCGGGRRRTSESSAAFACTVAMNGGFFAINHPRAFCLNAVVSDGRLVQTQAQRSQWEAHSGGGVGGGDAELAAHVHANVHFGLTDHGHFFVGHVDAALMAAHAPPPSAAPSSTWRFVQLVSGVVWLVKDGRAHANDSWWEEEDQTTPVPRDAFASTVSARTAIGHDAHGHLMLLVVNGKSGEFGLDLAHMAELCLRAGLVNAINLDGGGSATLTHRHVLVNDPSEEACPERASSVETCERAVTSIVCLHSFGLNSSRYDRPPSQQRSAIEPRPSAERWDRRDVRHAQRDGGASAETLMFASADRALLALLLCALLLLPLCACWWGPRACTGHAGPRALFGSRRRPSRPAATKWEGPALVETVGLLVETNAGDPLMAAAAHNGAPIARSAQQ